MPGLGRRAFVLGAAALASCGRSEGNALGGSPSPRSVPVSPNVRVVEMDFGRQPWGAGRAAVVVPTFASPGTRFPVLVALHGRGEAMKAPAEGALGWPRDYALVRAFDRLRAPPLTPADYEGLADPARLADTNASFAQRPFHGLIVACPYLPDVRPAATGDIGAQTRFILDVLLPRVRAETPALAGPEATAIDGVSLGGVVALRIGLAYAERFGAVGAIQPALANAPSDPQPLTALAAAARGRRPDLKLHLLTSHDDYFHDPVVELSGAWTSAGIAHDFADVPGPHDYVFNRGPGSIELLVWHDRALARG
jgi:iron(III)-salmochelin esterase